MAKRYRFRQVAAHEVETLRGLDARGVIRALGIPAWKVPLIARHMHALAARDIARMRLFPGIDAVLAALDEAGLGLAIVSSNTEDNVRRVLGPANAARFAHFSCGASIFGKARRLRSLFRSAGIAPGDALAIGDEIRDAEAAREAGCRFAAVGWGYTRADALAAFRPETVFANPGAIVSGILGDHWPLFAPGTGEPAVPEPNGL